jgi:hypothetical protein
MAISATQRPRAGRHPTELASLPGDVPFAFSGGFSPALSLDSPLRRRSSRVRGRSGRYCHPRSYWRAPLRRERYTGFGQLVMETAVDGR